MSSWGKEDGAYDAPLWAATQVNVRPTQDNANNLYQNTTQDYWEVDLPNGGKRLANVTVGLFGVDSAEEQVAENAGLKPAHSGWVLRTVGAGGRAGRVTQEVLVALSTVTTDNTSDNAQFPNATITVSQPVALQSVTANASGSNTVTLSVSGTTVVPAGAVLSYQWQVNNNTGGTWVNIDNGVNVSTGQPGNMIKSNANTATLTLAPTTNSSNNSVYRAVITATNPGIAYSTATAYSANGQVRIY